MCVSLGSIAHSAYVGFCFFSSHSFHKTLVKTLANRFLYTSNGDPEEEVIFPKYRHVFDKMADDVSEMKTILQQLE